MLRCPGSLMSLYGPTFHITPVDLGIIFQCTLYVSCIMSSCLVKINSFQMVSINFQEAKGFRIFFYEAMRFNCFKGSEVIQLILNKVKLFSQCSTKRKWSS